ncbi:MAG: anti-sigma factor family protein [Myxococcales bacterium]
MTGEHVQDLLLDLAYGELPPERIAEVEAHLASCDACRTERDELQRTRALLEPLRALEEPRPGFDDRILQGARAEAGLQADGTPGPTIEVKGSVKPLGLHAGRVDPLAGGVRVARKETSRRSVWLKRAVVGASIAGAAGVAFIVGTSLRERAVDRTEEVVAIRVRTPPPEASFRAAPPPPPSASPPEPRREETAPLGSGGDLARNSPMAAPSAPPPQREAMEPAKAAPAPQPSSPMAEASNARRKDPIEPAPKAPPPVSPSEADKFGGIAGGAVSADASSQNRLRESSLKAEQPDPDRLEDSAGEARRSGQYARAAELYQLAAGARRSANDSPRAAWDLAHAVECLAAASKLTEAGGIRAELLRSYPSEEGPRHAADRALGYPANAPH